jgi:hypothetical protein
MAEAHPERDQIGTDLHDRLTADEDDELRRLGYLFQMGLLSESKQERLLELRLRDDRRHVREPREFGPS